MIFLLYSSEGNWLVLLQIKGGYDDTFSFSGDNCVAYDSDFRSVL